MPPYDVRQAATPARRRAYRLARRRWLRELFFEEWTLKLVALVITLALWLGVTSRSAPTIVRLRGVPLSFLLPADLEISNDPREQVEVTLSGERRKLDDLASRNLVVTSDVSGYREGERVARMNPDSISMDLPEGVNVVRVEPNTIPLRLERRIERFVEVGVRIEGRPAEGFEVRSVEAIPARVAVRGPASRVRRLERAQTETVSLDDRRESFTLTQVAIDIEDEKIVALDPAVEVRIVIGERTNGSPPSTQGKP